MNFLRHYEVFNVPVDSGARCPSTFPSLFPAHQQSMFCKTIIFIKKLFTL